MDLMTDVNKKRKRPESDEQSDGEQDDSNDAGQSEKPSGSEGGEKPRQPPSKKKRWDAETKTLKAETDFTNYIKGLKNQMGCAMTEMIELTNLSKQLENDVPLACIQYSLTCGDLRMVGAMVLISCDKKRRIALQHFVRHAC